MNNLIPTNNFHITRYASPLGNILIASDGKALTGLWLNTQNPAEYTKTATENPTLEIFCKARQWLDVYFTGEIPDFTPAIRFIGTEFQLKVWNIIKAIPYGKTTTYGEIAKQIITEKGTTMSAQAVGGAVGKNPISIIVPCHRVLGAGGRLTGYTGGIEKKISLLKIENIIFKEKI